MATSKRATGAFCAIALLGVGVTFGRGFNELAPNFMWRLSQKSTYVKIVHHGAGRAFSFSVPQPVFICSLLMAPRKIGPFELERQIGIGGMGIVYSAIYPENGRKVAVKVLTPGLHSDRKLQKRFEREIEILKRLDHPNIVKYLAGGIDAGQRYYVMEFIDGGSLQDKLKKRKRFSWEQTIHVGRQVSAALEHAHNAGIIHRDLKPANLFLSKKGRLKLGDFGIARDTEATALTAAGKTVGTYAYMAPEQIQATHPITGKTDLYALGCLLYEVIVGETPFVADSNNPMDMLMQHLNDEPYNVTEKVPDCPVQLDALIDRLLAKNPDDRPFDALAVHTELGEIRDAVNAGHSISLGSTVAADTKVPTATKETAKDAAAKAKKKKKKKSKDVPFHEQTWFLATCLVILLLATVWLLMPPGENWYADKWRPAMQGDEYAQRETLEKHIDVYLQTFPEGQYVEEARQLSDKLHANILEPQLKNLGRRDEPVSPPFKAACVQAAVLEDEEGLVYFPTWADVTGQSLAANPLPAIQRWHELIQKSATLENAEEEETRWLIQVCRNHFDYFRQKFLESDQSVAYLRSRLEAAEILHAEGKPEQALAIWDFLYKTFGKVQRFGDLTEYARKRFGGIKLPMPESSGPTSPVTDRNASAGSD